MTPSTALAATLVDELLRCGLDEVVLAPGSRSAPLAMEFYRRPALGDVRLSVRIDEPGVPLLVLTADRPPELRGTGANQTIDQLKLYGSAVRWFCELGVAEEQPLPGYWRSAAARAWGLASGAAGGGRGPGRGRVARRGR